MLKETFHFMRLLMFYRYSSPAGDLEEPKFVVSVENKYSNHLCHCCGVNAVSCMSLFISCSMLGISGISVASIGRFSPSFFSTEC